MSCKVEKVLWHSWYRQYKTCWHGVAWLWSNKTTAVGSGASLLMLMNLRTDNIATIVVSSVAVVVDGSSHERRVQTMVDNSAVHLPCLALVELLFVVFRLVIVHLRQLIVVVLDGDGLGARAGIRRGCTGRHGCLL